MKKREYHGMSYTIEYRIYKHILGRCYTPTDKAFKNYGGRGITVCEKWRNSFIAFYKDVGKRPSIYATLDREDNDGNYEPNNFRWVNDTVQSRNRRFCKLTLEKARSIRKEKRRGPNGRGEGLTRKEIAIKYGVSLATIKKYYLIAIGKKQSLELGINLNHSQDSNSSIIANACINTDDWCIKSLLSYMDILSS